MYQAWLEAVIDPVYPNPVEPLDGDPSLPSAASGVPAASNLTHRWKQIYDFAPDVLQRSKQND